MPEGTERSSETELDRLAEEFLARRRQGADVSVASFAAAHPHLRARIEELFPVLLRMEDLAGEARPPRLPAMRRYRLVSDGPGGTPRLRITSDPPSPAPSCAGGGAAAAASGSAPAGDPAGLASQAPAGAEADRYHLVGEIGRGGMGVVLRVRDVELGRDVAVKVLHEALSERPDVVARFVEEAQVGGQLQHPGIVPVHDLGRFADGRPFFTMKLVQGRTLGELLSSRRTPEQDRARYVAVFASVCRTVAYAHARRVVHRDLKPANVLVGSFGEVFVLDWGLARVLDGKGEPERTETPGIATVRSVSEGAQSRAGTVMGTPAYMPPEQARGETERVDERADVFALGAMLTEILTGSPPYGGAHDESREPLEIVRAAATGMLEGARERLSASGADPELVATAEACLAPSPEERPRDASEVARRVDAYLEGLETKADLARLDAAAARGRAEAERRARVRTTALGALTVLATAIGLATWAWNAELDRRRRDRADADVLAATDDAARFRARAEAAADAGSTEGRDASWAEAIAAGRRAVALAGSGDAAPEAAEHARSVLADVECAVRRTAESVERAERERRATTGMECWIDAADFACLVAEPDEEEEDAARGRFALLVEELRTLAAAVGVDLATAPPEGVADAVHAKPFAGALVEALDRWAAYAGAAVPSGRARWPPADEALRWLDALDPDPVRREVRHASPDRLAELVGSGAAVEWPIDSVASLARRSLRGVDRFLVINGASPGFWIGPERAASTTALAELLGSARARSPGDFEVTRSLALLLLPTDADESIRLSTIALALRPANLPVRHELALALLRRGRTGEAIEVLRDAVRLAPDAMHLRMHLAYELSREGHAEEADSEFAVVMGRVPRDSTCRFLRGHALIARGDVAGGRKAIAGAAALDRTGPNPPPTASARILALELSSAGRYGAVYEILRTELDRSVGENPADPPSLPVLMLLGSLGRGEEALARLDSLSARLPTTQFLGCREMILTTAGPLRDSQAIARLALATVPKDAPPQQVATFARALASIHDHAAAAAGLAEAVRRGAASPADRMSLAWQLWFAGRFDEALAEAETATRADPSCGASFIRGAAAWTGEIDSIAKGEKRPRTADQAMDWARGCGARGLSAAAARLTRFVALRLPAADAARPGDELQDAAAWACQAGFGRSSDAPADPEERARLRAQSRSMLRSALAENEGRLGAHPEAILHAVRSTRLWECDVRLEPSRDPNSLGALTEDERTAWTELWAEVAALRGRAQEALLRW